MNPTTTLARIRACHPCSTGWTTLITGLGYSDGNYDPDRVVSLADVATTNNVQDALWCVCALDWSDVAVRRAVIRGVILPAVTRALKHTTDPRVHNCVDAVRRWCDGDDTVDLKAARKGARSAAYADDAAAADAAYAAYAAYAAADAAYAAYAAYAAAYAYAAAAADAAADAAAYAYAAAERTQQRIDLLANFALVALAVS